MSIKKIVTTASIVSVLLVNAVIPASAATTSNPSANDCLGVERQTRNTPGGDREYGGLGPDQREWVKTYQPYGQWLNGEWKAAQCPKK